MGCECVCVACVCVNEGTNHSSGKIERILDSSRVPLCLFSRLKANIFSGQTLLETEGKYGVVIK